MTSHLEAKVTAEGADTLSATLSGIVDETLDLSGLVQAAMGKNVELDLAHIKRINSAGVREWVRFIDALGAATREVALSRCAPAIVQQIAMIPTVRGAARIRSFLAPFVCTSCDEEQVVELGSASALDAPRKCACGGDLELDDTVEPYQLVARLT